MKIILLSIMLSLEIMAFDVDTASKIFNKIFTAIFTKEPIKIYVLTKEYEEVINKALSLELVKELELADIALITTVKELNETNETIVFTTSLEVLREKENVIGAFYWEYGRPKIIFIQERLKVNNIKLSKPFQRYIVKRVP